MSKEINNVYTLEDVEKRGYHPLMFRWQILSKSYRKMCDFKWETLDTVKNIWLDAHLLLSRLLPVFDDCEDVTNIFWNEILAHLLNDFNTPLALRILERKISYYVRLNPLTYQIRKQLAWELTQVQKLLCLFDFSLLHLEEDVVELLDERHLCKLHHQEKEADKLKKKIEEMGYYHIEDIGDEQVVITLYKN